MRTSVELVDELIHHRFFQSLRQVDWSDYQLGPILIASVLINLLELSSPLYINIIYTSVLPSGSMASLVVLTIAVVLLMVLGFWAGALYAFIALRASGGDWHRLWYGRRAQVRE